MATIDEGLLNKKVEAAQNSKSKTNVFNDSDKKMYASSLREILYDTIIHACPSFEDFLRIGDIVINYDVSGNVDLSFDSDVVHKDSLWKSSDHHNGRTGSGVRNIVALFSTGYTPKKSLYAHGYWDRNEGVGRVKTHTNKNTGKPGLESNDFMNEAISYFNSRYSKYGVFAYLSKKYLNGTF